MEIAIGIFITFVIVTVYVCTRKEETFPQYYHEECFNCNKGQGACKDCPYNK